MDGPSEPPRLLIAWHSRTGASEAMAKAAYQTAKSEALVDLIAAEDVQPEMILAASAYLFVCPENLGGISGAMKEMFDRCYYSVLGRIEGHAYATITAAGSDGEGAVRQIDRIVTGWRLKRVSDPLIVNLEAQTPEEIMAQKEVPENSLDQCREIGALLAAGASMGLF